MKTLIPMLLIAATVATPALAQEMRPYSDVRAQQQAQSDDAQRAYQQGRADQAHDDQNYAPRYAPNLDAARPPVYASAPDGRRYDGYCFARQQHAKTTGTIVGAVLGGFLGNSVSSRWDRTGPTIGGAMLGSVLGSSIGSDSVQCADGAYYAYDAGYYAPPPPPSGYVTVFFDSRPSYGYSRVYGYHGYGRPYGGYHGGYHRW